MMVFEEGTCSRYPVPHIASINQHRFHQPFEVPTSTLSFTVSATCALFVGEPGSIAEQTGQKQFGCIFWCKHLRCTLRWGLHGELVLKGGCMQVG